MLQAVLLCVAYSALRIRTRREAKAMSHTCICEMCELLCGDYRREPRRTEMCFIVGSPATLCIYTHNFGGTTLMIKGM